MAAQASKLLETKARKVIDRFCPIDWDNVELVDNIRSLDDRPVMWFVAKSNQNLSVLPRGTRTMCGSSLTVVNMVANLKIDTYQLIHKPEAELVIGEDFELEFREEL